jgi:hypothetical protein
MAASAYNFSSVKGLEDAIDRRSSEWIAQLKWRFEGGQEFDFSLWATYFTLDIMGEVAFGKDLKCVEKGCDTEGLNKAFKVGLPVFGFLTRMHVVAEWINWTWIGRFLEWQVPRDDTIGPLIRFGRKALKERIEEPPSSKMEKRNDMLQRYVLSLKKWKGCALI